MENEKLVFEDWLEKTVLNEDVENTIIAIIKQYPPESGWKILRYPDEKIGEDRTRIVFKIRKYEKEDRSERGAR